MKEKATPTSTTMQIRVKAPLHDWVREQAARQERSANWIINKAIEAAAAQGESKGAASPAAQQ